MTIYVIRPSGPASYQFVEVRIVSSHRDWESETLYFLMITFQRNGFQVIEKDTPDL